MDDEAGPRRTESKPLRSDGKRNPWYGLTPDQRADRLQRGAETRRRHREHLAELQEQQVEREARRVRANAAQRARRNRSLGRPVEETPQFTVVRPAPGSGEKTFVWEQVPPNYHARRAPRFWPYVDMSGGRDACWPWHGSRRYDTDYGQFYWRWGTMPAHRAAWSLHHGLEIPHELVVDHLCCCTWCQNPDHLEPVTRDENVRRTHRRLPEATRVRTSFEPPWEDRWYPFGRRLYDAHGRRLGQVAERDVDDDDENEVEAY